VPNNTDPPEYTSRTTAHHVVELFKERLNGTTDVGFRCHCGHKARTQFTDYQAMTSHPSTVPDNICDLVITAWRAHTKDLDDVHPNAEDQIRDFFSQHLEQPGGPTVTTPRYPLTAIPLGTPKPKSLAVSAYVDEDLRRIIVDYAEKLGIAVEPKENAEWDVAANADRPWYASENVATATAMREYLARLLYGDDGLVENLLADEKGDNPWRQIPIPSKDMRAAWEKWDCLFTEPYGKRCSLFTYIFRGNLQNFSGWGEPDCFEEFDEKNFNTSPNIFWRPSGTTWGEVEEKVKNTTPSDSQVDLANKIGKLAVEAAARGESTFRANVTLPGPLEYLVFAGPLGTSETSTPQKTDEGQADVQTEVSAAELDEVVEELKREDAEESRSDLLEQIEGASKTAKEISRLMKTIDEEQPAPSSDRPTRIILRSYAADDKPRIERLLGLARQLQIPVQLAGPWSCTAFPKGEEAHPALDVVFPEVLVHPRHVLILAFPNGEHIGDHGGSNLSEIENQLLWETREQDQRFITSLIELLGLHTEASRGDIAAAVERSGTHYEALDGRVRNILGAVDGEETDEAAKRVMADLDEWKRGQESWRNSAIALRQETDKNQRNLQADVNAALGIHPEQSLHSALRRAKWLREQNEYQTEKLAEILGYKSDDFSALLERVQRVIREHQTLLGERIESNAKIDRLGASLDKVVDERDGLKDRMMGLVVDLTNARAEINKLRAARLPCGGCSTHLERAEKERDSLGEKLDTVHRDLAKRLGLPKDTGWSDILSTVERIVEDSQDHAEVRANNKELGVKLDTVEKERDSFKEHVKELGVKLAKSLAEIGELRTVWFAVGKERDTLKERLDTAITAERQTIAQRIDLALTGGANCTDLESMLRVVELLKGTATDAEAAKRNLIATLSLNEDAKWGEITSFVAGKRDGLKDCLRRLAIHQSLLNLIADALDAPNEEKDLTTDDGELNTALVDRLAGYYHRLYTAAGFTDPPQGGWSELIAEAEFRLSQPQKA